MNEQERADWLARAVDRLIQNRGVPETPSGLDDDELEGLMRVAQARLESAHSTARAGLQHEGAVWDKVLRRLEERREGTAHQSGATTHFRKKAGIPEGDPDMSEGELRELEEMALLRKRMADEIIAFAETQREAVWQKVQSRLQARENKMGLFSFFKRHREAKLLAPALDGIVVGQTLWQANDSRMDELIDVARKRRELGRMAQSASHGAEQRVWSRIEPAVYGIVSRRVGPAPTAHQPTWRRAALAAAAIGLLAAAVGPIPATGLANHPAVRAFEFIGGHVGVAGTSGPPSGDTPADIIEGTPATAGEAAVLLGVPVSQPTALPPGFTLSASLYYPRGITSSTGVFLLTYTSDEGTILVFQEAASGAGLAASAGSIDDYVLTDGTPASYIQGAWTPGASGFSWSDDNAQTLVFDRDGVRTIIEYIGPPIAIPELLEVAGHVGSAYQ